MKVSIIDYGLSNLLSVRRAAEYCGAQVELVQTPEAVLAAPRLILPGVGAFEDGMNGLAALGLIEPIRQKAAEGTPLLGICLGMQMLFDESDEFGRHQGLGLIPGRVERIPAVDTSGVPQRVPNIGWRPLVPAHGSFAGTALQNVPAGGECYCVHSYEAKPKNEADRLADSPYGGRSICAAALRGSVMGTQFHPEKSGPVGLSILKAFLEL